MCRLISELISSSPELLISGNSGFAAVSGVKGSFTIHFVHTANFAQMPLYITAFYTLQSFVADSNVVADSLFNLKPCTLSRITTSFLLCLWMNTAASLKQGVFIFFQGPYIRG